jgi:hypothetical protein
MVNLKPEHTSTDHHLRFVLRVPASRSVLVTGLDVSDCPFLTSEALDTIAALPSLVSLKLGVSLKVRTPTPSTYLAP